MSSEQSAATQYFIFVYREVQHFLPVANITEIIEVSEWLPFPRHFPGCFGNIVHRNQLLPVFDPTVLGTDLAEKPVAPDSVIVIVIHYEGTAFGLALDQQITIASLNPLGDAKPAEPVTDHPAPTQARNKPFVAGTRAYRGHTLVALDIAAIGQAVRQLCGNQQFSPEQDATPRAEDASAVTEATGHRFMCVRIEDTTLAIPIEQVMEVIEDYDVTPVFKVTPRLRGLINLRGQVIACFDISQELGFPLRKLDERNQFIVLQGEGAELALCVDKILGLRALPHDRIQSTETILSGDITRYIHGVFETAQTTLLILSVTDVFESPHLQPYLR